MIKIYIQKKGMALLVTLLFIMLITLSIGVGLKQINTASKEISSEQFLYQTSIIVDDVLKFLINTEELNDINSSEDLDAFLSYSPIPFESNGLKVIINLSSARAKYNINSIKDANLTQREDKISFLKEYFNKYRINTEFVDILLDGMDGIKADNSYNSEIFNDNPYLFRDYITSKKHFEVFKNFYKTRYDDTLKNINFDNLFYFSKDINNSYSIDLNFATTEAWEMMLGCDKIRAEELSSNMDKYDTYKSINLSDEELNRVRDKFKTSFFEPYIDVVITIFQNSNDAKIEFEYDIKKKEGSNFVYEI